jgi:hypothetical protein
MGFRPTFGLFLYVALMTVFVMAAIESSAALARRAAVALAFIQDDDPTTSRVESGLEAQARVAEWQPASYVIETRAVERPDVSAVALARAMDVAEDVSLPPPKAVGARALPAKVPMAALPIKPRVAGWIRRIKLSSSDRTFAESTARIIERSLKSEL